MEALEGLVFEVDGEAPATPEQQQEAQAAQALDAGAREWGMIAFVIGNGLAIIAPELKAVYTEDACMGWGRAMVPVAEKYGWNNPAAIPELGLIIATTSLAVPSVIAIRGRVQEIKAAKAADELQRKTATDAAPASGGG